MSARFSTLRQIPGSIWALGFVSLLMDVSSELIHSLLPVFMVTTLSISVFTVGLIEGAAEATALIVKVFSGALSDYFGKRKPLAILGYGLGAFTKPFLRWPPRLAGSSPPGWPTASERAYAAHRETRWWRTSPRLNCAALPLACASRSTPWARFWGRCWR